MERQASLSNSLLRASFTVIVLALVAISSVFTVYSNQKAKETLATDLLVMADILGNRSSAALIFGDIEGAQRNLESTTFSDSIVSACLYDRDGTLFVAYFAHADANAKRCKNNIAGSRAGDYQYPGHLGVVVPIIDGSEQLGTIVIESSTAPIASTLMNALATSMTAFAVIIMAAYVILRRLIRITIAPLRNLHDTALTISINPYLELRAERVQNDEVGRLVEVFNDMLDTLGKENNALMNSERRFRALAENSPVGIYQMNNDLEFIYANDTWQKLTGMPQHCLEADYLKYVESAEREELVKVLGQVQKLREPQVIEYHFKPPDGVKSMIFMEHIAPVLCYNEGKVSVDGMIGSLLDISDLKSAQMELENLAFYDPLTSLPNRRYFRDNLNYEVVQARRDKTRVAILMLDLDNFKKVNDTLGHDAGDELLSVLGKRLSAVIAQKDLVSRMGGDEFMMLLRDVKSKEEISNIATRVLTEIREPIVICGHDIEVSASIGVGIYPDDAHTPEELIRNADLALYHSKEGGRNCLSFFSKDLQTRISERVHLERKLRDAIKTDQLTFFVQPKWSLHEGRLISGEVLIRWFDEAEGPISPALFIPIAEEAGLILELGDWLLDRVFDAIAWHNEELKALGIESLAINLSARQFFSNNLAVKIESALKSYNINPSMIEFELTESAVMEDTELAISVMHELKNIGCRLSMDDFGTGYSSLSYLKRFPLDAVKIDQSFISDIPQDQNDVEISAAIIAMGHKLGLEVVAEGVETQAQMDFLVQQNCDYAQGYMIAKPMPFERLFIETPEINKDMGGDNNMLRQSAG